MTALAGPIYVAPVIDSDKQRRAKETATRTIARWRDAIIALRFDGKAKPWADRAGVSPTTITRSMDPESPSTTKLENLHALARAVGIPSVLDFLDQQANGESPSLPNESELARMIERAMAELPVGATNADYQRVVASSLHTQLSRFQASGGYRDSQGEEISPDADAPPPMTTKRSARAKSRTP